jgi:hypothetical protein
MLSALAEICSLEASSWAYIPTTNAANAQENTPHLLE